MKTQNVLNTFEHTDQMAAALSSWKDGAGDRDRTGDIQLGNLIQCAESTVFINVFNDLKLVTLGEIRWFLTATMLV